jgi:hypothetical protein
MKSLLHIHFFGCSFTAGDELADEKYFPWKFVENHTPESYNKKRIELMSNDMWDTYYKENKLCAYPALISQVDSTIKTYNHASNGKSHRRNILDILRLVEELSYEIDVIYFQISPPNRNMIIGDNCIHDIIESNPSETTQEYILAKLKLSRLENQSIQDLMDMYMLQGYLKTKNIPFYFLNLGNELPVRETDIKNTILHNDEGIINFDFLSINNFTNIVDLSYTNLKYDRLLGGHMNPEQHWEVASAITTHIKEVTSKY